MREFYLIDLTQQIHEKTEWIKRVQIQSFPNTVSSFSTDDPCITIKFQTSKIFKNNHSTNTRTRNCQLALKNQFINSRTTSNYQLMQLQNYILIYFSFYHINLYFKKRVGIE